MYRGELSSLPVTKCKRPNGVRVSGVLPFGQAALIYLVGVVLYLLRSLFTRLVRWQNDRIRLTIYYSHQFRSLVNGAVFNPGWQVAAKRPRPRDHRPREILILFELD